MVPGVAPGTSPPCARSPTGSALEPGSTLEPRGPADQQDRQDRRATPDLRSQRTSRTGGAINGRTRRARSDKGHAGRHRYCVGTMPARSSLRHRRRRVRRYCASHRRRDAVIRASILRHNQGARCLGRGRNCPKQPGRGDCRMREVGQRQASPQARSAVTGSGIKAGGSRSSGTPGSCSATAHMAVRSAGIAAAPPAAPQRRARTDFSAPGTPLIMRRKALAR